MSYNIRNVVETVRNDGGQVDGPLPSGYPGVEATPLLLAAAGGHADIAELLLDYGARVNQLVRNNPIGVTGDQDGAKDSSELGVAGHPGGKRCTGGEGPSAFERGPCKCTVGESGCTVKLLAGSDHDGATALLIAVTGQHVKLADLLLQNGANPYLADSSGQTPCRLLHAAFEEHCSTALACLFVCLLNADIPDSSVMSLLACWCAT